jgi:hypothetical protein
MHVRVQDYIDTNGQQRSSINSPTALHLDCTGLYIRSTSCTLWKQSCWVHNSLPTRWQGAKPPHANMPTCMRHADQCTAPYTQLAAQGKHDSQ